ncbi:pilus assembly protein [Chitinilyticum aquatile]|uniref:pilus assembly protein n=1 Tax=Chitinilyticum aquatile TaxID=362520 RepID=UPI00042189D4|nr:PilC/PilY family type IV pilus protein [Chitinilyticum aquatile]
MNNHIKYISPTLLLICSAVAAAPQYSQGGRDPFRPLYVSSNEPPLNLLVLSRDHKLFYEAYNDASDLDGDGIYDVGYRGYILKPGESTAAPGKFKIDYYGYFDSYKCYRYNNSRFEPVEKTNNKKCPNNSGAPWSGDYLNYLTTSRMDAIRRVLYGGKRSTDTATDTILERAFIPQDAHSWGKEYKDVSNDGYDIQDYTPLGIPNSGRRHLFANTTLCAPGGCANSFNNPPLLRQIINSDRRIWQWVSIERPVAGSKYDNGNNGPTISSITDYTVRVQACVTGLLENECKKYGNTYKPIGLLQQYGDSDAMRFGLLTGSYSNNLQGGVLRKNIGKIDDEIDLNNGTFKTTNGIIKTIDKLRIQGFRDSFEYFVSGGADDACSYGNAFAQQLANGNCSGWGNPIGEMMLEAVRYLSGASSPTSAFKTDTKGATLGLPEVTSWADPYGIDSGTGKARNSVCAKPAITLISDINPNWDGDYMASTSINGKTLSPVSLLDAQWSAEFGGARSVIIGSNGSTSDGAPTPKTATTFSNLRGLPDEPAKLGSYMTAAVAEFARTNDINPAGSSGTDGEKQLVNTMAIALASPLPSIKIPVNGKIVTIIPFAKSPSQGGSGTGSSSSYRPVNQIVDYYIDNIYNVTGFPFSASVNGGRPQYVFRINFEDVEYGGDHDMDAIAQYTITLQADNTIKVVVDSIYAAGGIDQHMGYVISGTTKDGVYLVVKDQGGQDVKYWMDAKPAGTGNPSGDPINPQGNLTALSDTRTFSPSSTGSTVTDLKTPLWYAAKYGGFVDDEAEGNVNRDKLDNLSEWDSDGDGIPDNYFLVTNPLNLKSQLDRAFSRLDAVSRSSAPVGSSSGGGSEDTEFRIYRTAYKIDQWSGNLSALPLSTNDLTLGVPYWEAASADKLQPWSGFGGTRVLATWNPGPSSDPYARKGTAFEPGAGSFYMSASQKDALKVKNYPATDTRTADQVMIDRINYIRGDNTNEGTGTNKMRRREQSGTQSNYIADILDAQPYSVGPVPDPDYYQDAGYKAFANQYKDRLNFVYAGANGGVFHAFLDDVTPGINQQWNGMERFGYVPSFIFDKLRKLEDPAYSHEYYLNGRAAVQDVKTTDTGWTGSDWHTYLVASAGFGGKGIFALDITKPNDVGSSEIPKVTRWEYFNSTDTSQGDPEMGYQPGSPLLTKMNDGKWYAITGNGFQGIEPSPASGVAVLYFLQATGPGTNGWDSTTARKITISAALAGTGFNGLSAPVAADLDDNGTADVIYAGDMLGNLWKFDVRDTNPANWKLGRNNTPLFKATRPDGAQPIVMPPAVSWERKAEAGLSINNKRLMVYFGTGKFVEDCDKAGSSCTGQSDTASFYGIVDTEEQFNGSTAETATQSSFTTITKSQLLEQRIASYGSADLPALTTLTGKTVALSDVENFRCILPRNAGGTFGSKCTDSDSFVTPPVEYGWYADFPLLEERHVGMPRIAGGTVLFNTLIPENAANSVCGFTARSSVMVLNLDDGGQSRQRFPMANNSGDKLSGIKNVGLLSTTSAPNGTTTVKGSKPSGLNDERGFGRNYNGKKSQSPCEKAIDVEPTGKAREINVCDSRVVIPVNWTEIIQ